jgi:hypothetical protein
VASLKSSYGWFDGIDASKWVKRVGADVVTVPIESLSPADSPRLDGEDLAHIHALAESKTCFSPIIVHRQTMRVIDGAHRLAVAKLRGETRIPVRFFDGDEKDAFVIAVEANIVHGLPLSLADRKAASERIVGSHPHLSDRTIARITGLSDKTVAVIRRNASVEVSHVSVRIGMDGRARRLDRAQGRTVAAKLIAANPTASLREISRQAGISPETVRDVRKRLRRGESPIPSGFDTGLAKNHASMSPRAGVITVREASEDDALTLQKLRKDPSIRLTEKGRLLLVLLRLHAIEPGEWEHIIDNVPAHCTQMVIRLARSCARSWEAFADGLEAARIKEDQRSGRPGLLSGTGLRPCPGAEFRSSRR